MKKIILASVVIGVIGVLAFYANNSAAPATESVPAKIAYKPSASAVVAPAQPAVPVTKPQSTPVGVVTRQIAQDSASTVQETKPDASKPNTAAISAEITSTVAELGRLIDSGDYEMLMTDFMPPEELDALLVNAGKPGQPMTLSDLADRMHQNPKTQRQMAAASQFMAYLQTQTPILGVNGETASYPTRVTVNGKNSLDFVKIGAKWYVKDGVQFFK